MTCDLSGNQVEVSLLQLLGHRPATAYTDHATIHFTNRRHFSVTGNALLDHFDTQFAGQREIVLRVMPSRSAIDITTCST